MYLDYLNLLTVILAGQPGMARQLEHPKRDNLFQRIGVYHKIEGINSPQTMKDYIELGLKGLVCPADQLRENITGNKK